MKTIDIPENVLFTWKERTRQQQTALETATDLMRTWETIETSYMAGKASWSPTMKLRTRRIAERTRVALNDAKSVFIDAEAWLNSWAKAGQERMRAFAVLGARGIEPFEPSVATDTPEFMPGAKAVLKLMDEATDHLAEIVWDGELYQLFTASKEA